MNLVNYSKFNLKAREFLFLILGLSIPISAAAISISMILILFLWIIDGNYKKKIHKIIKDRYQLSILVFTSFALISFLWLSVEPVNAHKNWMIFIIPVLATAVSPEIAKRGIFMFLIGMMIVESGVYFNILSNWQDYSSRLVYEQVFWTVSHITYTPFLAFAVGLSLATILGKQNKGWKYFVTIVFLISMIVNLVLTGGRAGYLALICSWTILSFYFFRNDLKKLFLMFLALVMIFSLAWQYSPVLKHRALKAKNELVNYTQQRLNNENVQKTSVGVRLLFAESGLRLFSEKPIFGHGIGSFENALKKFSEAQENKIHLTTNPHNSIVLSLVQYGIVGTLLFFLIFYSQVLKFSKQKQEYSYKVIMLLLPVFFLFISMYDSYLWGHHSQALFAYFAAIIYRDDVISISSSNSAQKTSL